MTDRPKQGASVLAKTKNGSSSSLRHAFKNTACPAPSRKAAPKYGTKKALVDLSQTLLLPSPKMERRSLFKTLAL